MTMGEIEETVADPFMGFNIGSSYLRHDARAALTRFYFESPVIRLGKDHGYVDAFKHGSYINQAGAAPEKTIWVFRYYEKMSNSLGEGHRQEMEEIAIDLRRFILQVRQAIIGNQSARVGAFRVHLVAHSMGGLVARCYLQNICRNGTGNAQLDNELEIDPNPRGEARVLSHHVDKLFTYGTPHNGIEFRGWNLPRIPLIDGWQLSTFNRKKIVRYLKLSKLTSKDGVNHLDNAFDPARVFCLMGSNHHDYDAAGGMAKYAVGPSSDGLVAIANAYTEGSSRVVVHRSHSGAHGLVNSEAGYQNLRRFLFGRYKVIAKLHVAHVPLPSIHGVSSLDAMRVRRSFYVESATWVRGPATYRLNERKIANASAVLKRDDELLAELDGVKPRDRRFAYLFTGYLMADDHQPERAALFAIEIGLRMAGLEIDGADRSAELIDGDLLRETLSFRVGDDGMCYGFGRIDGPGHTPRRIVTEATEYPGQQRYAIGLGSSVDGADGGPDGVRATLELMVTPWNAAPFTD
jgi:pimeloyl-ACP methyl ester carboxylesterase